MAEDKKKEIDVTVIEVTELCSIIKNTKGLEGVTITGGEPFAQPKALLELVEVTDLNKFFGRYPVSV